MEDYPGNLRRRYVACLDILGFRTALSKNNPVNLANAYMTAINISKRVRETDRLLLKDPGVRKIGQPQESVKVPVYPNIFHAAVFSDSMFVFSVDESAASLDELCEYCFLVFSEFMRQHLPLRGAIAAGEAIVYPEDSLYLGQGIVDAYLLEQSLDVIGIVLQSGLASAAASTEALVSFETKETTVTSHLTETLMVPTHRDAMVTGESYIRTFEMLRSQAPPKLLGRYQNSIPVLAAMGKIKPESFPALTNTTT